MSKFLAYAVLGVGLLAGISLSAHAQSMSSLPPAGAPAASVPTQPQASTQRMVPDPGGSVTIRGGEHYQPAANATSPLVDHPYSGAEDKTVAGPKAN